MLEMVRVGISRQTLRMAVSPYPTIKSPISSAKFPVRPMMAGPPDMAKKATAAGACAGGGVTRRLFVPAPKTQRFPSRLSFL